MSNIINVSPDEKGRVFIELFGNKIEIDDSMFISKGVAIIKKFGDVYEVHKPVSKSQKRKAKVVAEAKAAETKKPEDEGESE